MCMRVTALCVCGRVGGVAQLAGTEHATHQRYSYCLAENGIMN